MSSKTSPLSRPSNKGLHDPARVARGEASVDLENCQLEQTEMAETFAARKAHFAQVWRLRQLIAADLCELDAALERLTWTADDRKIAGVMVNLERHSAALKALVGPRALERVLKLPRAQAS